MMQTSLSQLYKVFQIHNEKYSLSVIQIENIFLTNFELY